MFSCQLILLFFFMLSKLRHFSYFSVNNECKKEKIFLLCKIIGCPIVCCCRKRRSKTERRNVNLCIHLSWLMLNNEKKLAKMSHLHIFTIVILQMVQHSSLAICRRDLLCADYGWKYFLGPTMPNFSNGWLVNQRVQECQFWNTQCGLGGFWELTMQDTWLTKRAQGPICWVPQSVGGVRSAF